MCRTVSPPLHQASTRRPEALPDLKRQILDLHRYLQDRDGNFMDLAEQVSVLHYFIASY